MTDHEKNDLVEFRLTKLEEAVSALSTLKDIVLKWDVRFSEMGGFMNCPLHKVKMDSLEARADKVEKDVAEIKKFVYKATGALVVISILIQLAGPILLDKVYPRNPPVQQKVEYFHPNRTNAWAQLIK